MRRQGGRRRGCLQHDASVTISIMYATNDVVALTDARNTITIYQCKSLRLRENISRVEARRETTRRWNNPSRVVVTTGAKICLPSRGGGIARWHLEPRWLVGVSCDALSADLVLRLCLQLVLAQGIPRDPVTWVCPMDARWQFERGKQQLALMQSVGVPATGLLAPSTTSTSASSHGRSFKL